MSYKDVNKQIIEKQLLLAIQKICTRLRINLNEWRIDGDIQVNKQLFIAVRESPLLPKAKDLLQQYNELFNLEAIGVKVDPSYYWLKDITKKSRHARKSV